MFNAWEKGLREFAGQTIGPDSTETENCTCKTCGVHRESLPNGQTIDYALPSSDAYMFRKLPACGVFPLPKLRMELLRQPNIHTPRTQDGNPISNSIESLAVFTSVTSQFFNESVSCGYLMIVCFLQNLLWPCEEPAAFATTWWHSCKTHWAQTNTPFLFAGF